MCGAMDECDVVLTFVGQHIGSSGEVLGRLAWHFDVVCDCGILATGLHEIAVGLFRHLWHCVPSCYVYTITHSTGGV